MFHSACLSLCFSCLAAGVLSSAVVAVCPRYEIETLIELEPCGLLFPQQVISTGINNHGVVCGYLTCDTFDNRPFIWYGEGAIQALPMPEGVVGAMPMAINDDGHVVGWLTFDDLSYRSAFWFDGTTTHVLPKLFDNGMAEANAIADDGTIVGIVESEDVRFYAAKWQNRELELLPSGDGVVAWAKAAVSDQMIVGRETIGLEYHAAIWDGRGGRVILPLIDGYLAARAEAIDESGLIVGLANSPLDAEQPLTQAVSWRLGKKPTVLPIPKGRDRCSAHTVGPDGIVGGLCRGPGSDATVWKSGHPVDVLGAINDPPADMYHLSYVIDVTDDGRLLVYGGVGEAQDLLVLRSAASIPGDADCDGHVGFLDLLKVLASWGRCSDCVADQDGDDDSDRDDLLIVIENWGT